jgi:hypothetical protein
MSGLYEERYATNTHLFHVAAIVQVAGRRGESMSAVVRDAVRAYLNLDDDDRPVPLPGLHPAPAREETSKQRE